MAEKIKALISPNVFHISIDGKRTSFSLDKYLAELLAICLKEKPRTKEAHRAITLFLTEKLFAWTAFDPLLPISRQARRMAIAAIARPSLVESHNNWILAI